MITPQDDCPHDEFDHDICIDCGYERDPGEAIDRAMDAYELAMDNLADRMGDA